MSIISSLKKSRTSEASSNHKYETASTDGVMDVDSGARRRSAESGAESATATDAPANEYKEAGRAILPLRIKGFIFIAVLILYAAFLTAYVLGEKETLFKRFIGMEKAYEAEWELRQADLSVFNSIMGLYTDIDSFDKKETSEYHTRDYLRMVKDKFGGLKSHFPDATPAFTALNASLDAAIKNPSKHNLISLRKTLGNVRNDISQLVVLRQDKLKALVEDYRSASESVTTRVLGLGLLGIALMVVTVGVFFTHLTSDLRALEVRAGDIVRGDVAAHSGASVARRSDEVGQLGLAIERMASTLEQQERELEIERKKIFHKDKMAAIGTLAAGIAHEVGNPIAAISALVNETRKEQMLGDVICVNERCRNNLDFVLHHTERLANITREISAFSTPQPSKRQLLDINSLVRSASSLMKYDNRFSLVDLQLNLDSQLPAVYGIGDQLLQVVMNILINAADAVTGMDDRAPTITCATYTAGGMVVISVTDNGQGMDEETIDHAFEAFYTTKPPGKGTGLGLSLCHSIIADHGGAIEIESKSGDGATVKVLLPIEGIKEA